MNWVDVLRRVIFLYLLSWFIGSFYGMAMLYTGHFDHGFLGIPMDGTIKKYLYYAFSGAIGGTLWQLRLYHKYYETFKRRWFVWHTIRPFLCAGTAIMMIILLQSGLMLLQVNDDLASQIGLSFLVGFGYGKVMDKLKALTETLFNSMDISGSSDEKSDK